MAEFSAHHCGGSICSFIFYPIIPTLTPIFLLIHSVAPSIMHARYLLLPVLVTTCMLLGVPIFLIPRAYVMLCIVSFFPPKLTIASNF